MARFIFTLEMTQPMGDSLLLGCGIIGDPENVRGKTVQFGTLESEPILYGTGIAQNGLSAARMQLRSGFRTFIEISKEEALKLGVLEWTTVE